MVMTEAFGGATITEDSVFVESGDNKVTGKVYEKPTGAQSWAGFAHEPDMDNSEIYPIALPNGGTITAKMAAYFESDPVNVYFRFEKDAHPNVDPSYQTDNIELKELAKWTQLILQLTFHLKVKILLRIYNIVENDARVIIESVVVTPK